MPPPIRRNAIRQDDVITSVAAALQRMSYAHPPDFIRAMARAWEREDSPLARDAIAQILASARLSVKHHRPVCQDTGIVVVFAKVGVDVTWEAELTLQEMIDEGVRRAYGDPANPLRASIVADPLGGRLNTRDNTPAVVHMELVPGAALDLLIAAKGGGSENKARFAVLNPSDDVAEWVVREMASLGAGWCPPGIVAVGVGGTAEKAMLLAKEALLDPIDIDELREREAVSAEERLRLTLYDRLNALGIGAQGLGGRTTVLDVKVRTYPTHAASMPVALIPNCGATRHLHVSLDGSGPAIFDPVDVAD
jgi:fumarate hydratase, class I